MRNTILILSVLIVGLIACQESKPTMEELFPKQLNLLQHGIPIALQVPNDAKVNNRSTSFMQDVVIEGTNFYIQIYSQDAMSPSCAYLTKEAKADLQATNPNFQKTVLDEDCGFIYEVQVPGDSSKCHNFAFHRVLGNKLYSFSTTTSRRQPFTLEQVQNMYAVIKEQK